MNIEKGSFTLPGESGFEKLTLRLAEKWGADIIRDSDGTSLSDELVHSGYGIYSTICLIRDHNDWARENLDKLQQTFLCTPPAIAIDNELTIPLMDSFFEQQFTINDSHRAMKYWEVYDRTVNQVVHPNQWEYKKETGEIILYQITAWHKYTVSFLAYRVWEEISMYNHTTNGWEKEHLMQIDPRYPEVKEYLLKYMKEWCESHPDTTVVRFTSMFYNFVWIWGSDLRNRYLFSDWGSYDFAVSDLALDQFTDAYGYSLTAEDFINQGNMQVTHMPATSAKRDWMQFIHNFVVDLGRELVDIVHSYGKKAFVFYDDSWIGIEPYGSRFREFGFDGLIKCVFSGFEARICSGVEIPIHEIRLHPYLFPVGLGGAPTFMEGGDPVLDAKKYWISVRRALLFAPIERIGLGGYLHLVEGYPEFCDYIEEIAHEFRKLKLLHRAGKPYTIHTKVAILHYWGKLRSWSLSGHFHETYKHDLIHILESLSGLPIEVSFLSFEDIRNGGLQDVDVIINAGESGSAWSGGEAWHDNEVVRLLTQWVYEGGSFIGVNEPSAVAGYDNYFRMSHVLGIDEDTGSKICHGKWSFEVDNGQGILPAGTNIKGKEKRFLTDGKARVLLADGNLPVITINDFGKGKGIYLASFEVNDDNTYMLNRMIRYAGGEDEKSIYMTDNVYTECAYYPIDHRLVVLNNSAVIQKTNVETEQGGVYEIELQPYDTKFINL